MAATATYGDVMNLVGRFMPSGWEADHAARVCNRATNEIWDGFDWRETLVTLPPFYLIPGAQDHGSPAVAVPANFQGLRKAYIRDLSGGALTPTERELTPVRNLEITETKAFPKNISYEPSVSAFRLFPRVPDNLGPPFWMVEGTYKKDPTKLTASTYATTLLPIGDDSSFDTWFEVLKWAAMAFSGNPQAGSFSVQGGQVQKTGQAAIAEDYILRLAAKEGFELGDPVVAPAEGIYRGNAWGGQPFWGAR